jgi:hypothetical protein
VCVCVCVCVCVREWEWHTQKCGMAPSPDPHCGSVLYNNPPHSLLAVCQIDKRAPPP